MSKRGYDRARYQKSLEPDLDPVSPLKAARERRDAVTRQRQRARFQRQVGRLCECLVHLLHQAHLGTPRPFIPPQPIRRDNVFQVTGPRRVVRDWRSLPVPILPKPAPIKPQPTPTLYGTRYRSAAR